MTVFLRWLTSICDDTGFVWGSDRLREKVHFSELWRDAFAGWWLTWFLGAPTAWGSAWLARHPFIARCSTIVWLAGGLAALWHFGVDPIAALVAIDPVGVIGAVAFAIGYVSVLVFALRLGGNRLTRVPKACVIVGMMFGVYWLATLLTFRTVYGVDVWSPALWVDVERAWLQGVNFEWSAAGWWAGWTIAWVAALALVSVRAPRVWLACRKWGIRAMLWIVRLVIFASVVLFIAGRMGTAPMDVLLAYSRAVSSFPYLGELIGKGGVWPLLLVAGIFGSIIIFVFAVVMNTFVDLLSIGTKLLAIAYSGGVLWPDRKDPAKPVHVPGLEAWFERRNAYLDRKGVELQETARARRAKGLEPRAAREANSDMSPDGFVLLPDRVAPQPAVSEPSPVPAGEGREVAGGIADQSAPVQAVDDDRAAEDEEVDGAVAPPVDTPDRDAELALGASAGGGVDESAEAAALAQDRAREAEEFEAQAPTEEELDRIQKAYEQKEGVEYGKDIDEYTADEGLVYENEEDAALVDDPFGDGEPEELSDEIWEVTPDEPEEGLGFGEAFGSDEDSGEDSVQQSMEGSQVKHGGEETDEPDPDLEMADEEDDGSGEQGSDPGSSGETSRVLDPVAAEAGAVAVDAAAPDSAVASGSVVDGPDGSVELVVGNGDSPVGESLIDGDRDEPAGDDDDVVGHTIDGWPPDEESEYSPPEPVRRVEPAVDQEDPLGPPGSAEREARLLAQLHEDPDPFAVAAAVMTEGAGSDRNASSGVSAGPAVSPVPSSVLRAGELPRWEILTPPRERWFDF